MYFCIYIYIYVYFLEHICISIETSGRKYKVNGYKGYRDQWFLSGDKKGSIMATS